MSRHPTRLPDHNAFQDAFRFRVVKIADGEKRFVLSASLKAERRSEDRQRSSAQKL